MLLGSQVICSIYEILYVAHTRLGFGYQFNAIHDETNELFCAYKDMFETALSQNQEMRSLLGIYFPILNTLYVSSSNGSGVYQTANVNAAG